MQSSERCREHMRYVSLSLKTLLVSTYHIGTPRYKGGLYIKSLFHSAMYATKNLRLSNRRRGNGYLTRELGVSAKDSLILSL